jgi:hypothetical protein
MLPAGTTFKPIKTVSKMANETTVLIDGEPEIVVKVGTQKFALMVW